MPQYPKKLIEVALPLDDINAAAAKEKSIRHGHPNTLHLWWARRPLAAARAVLFAQLVNDPGGHRGWYKGKTKEQAAREREKLFDIIRDLVKWENTNNEEILERARTEIRKSWAETCRITGDDPDRLPPFHDPFAGGGSIPLEAQRLGLEAHASDLNPVAVLINKALIEIPPKFAGRKPVNPVTGANKQLAGAWKGAAGLAEDLRHYGGWMRDEAWRRIGHLYPTAKAIRGRDGVYRHTTPEEIKNNKGKVEDLTVIAWLWARTVESPTPAFHGIPVPLISSCWLSTKAGRETWVQPVIEGRTYRFTINTGSPKNKTEIDDGTKLGRGANFRCLLSGVAIEPDYIKAEGMAGRMGAKLMAIVAEGSKGRIFLEPTRQMEACAESAKPTWAPEQELNYDPRAIWCPSYGLTTYAKLFTPRQLVALTTFSDLVMEVRARIHRDALTAGWADSGKGIEAGGDGATAYADALAVYLGFALSKMTDRNSSLCFWESPMERLRGTFGRQALPMVWDYAETNPFAGAGGDFLGCVKSLCEPLEQQQSLLPGFAIQADAAADRGTASPQVVFSTDPPYYDNIGYADLSDFFYVWLRRSLRAVMPGIFSTVLVPKDAELIAAPYRKGGKEAAERFFMEGMSVAVQKLGKHGHPAFPVTIYYAFKQSDTGAKGTASTGWETFLDAVLRAGFSVTGTWPTRTELTVALKKQINALASSIVLVCRHRQKDAPTVSRKQFLRELEDTLPEAIADMIGGKEGISPVAPVDLAQSAIGPGMAVFSQYAAVLEADGSPMTVHTALTLINKAIDEYFTKAESDMDLDTRFCVDWFQQYGFKPGKFGEADVLARAKGTSVEGLAKSGVLQAGAGSVRLLKLKEYPENWDPKTDERTPIWEACHQLCRALQESEAAAGQLLARMPDKAEPIRQLAYRLYTLCERKKWAEEAGIYNGLIASWHSTREASQAAPPPPKPKQAEMNM